MSIALVCVIGIGTVFVGLIALILISYLMSALCRMFEGTKPEEKPAIVPNQMPRAKKPATNAPIANKQEIIAGVCAVIAEELGTDVSNIRVTSFKKL